MAGLKRSVLGPLFELTFTRWHPVCALETSACF
jgi:hypothetical protein